MPGLSIRRIDPDVYERLRIRAAKNGVSMEEEVRRLIVRAVSAPEKLGQFALHQFGPDIGIDLELPAKQPHEPPDLTP